MQKIDKIDWDLISFIKASEYRKEVMSKLNNNPKTPKELTKEIGIYFSHTSATLKELSDKNLVVCLTPQKKKGRIYTLTNEGKKVIEMIL